MAENALDLLTANIRADRAGKGNKAVHVTLDYTLVKRQSDLPPISKPG